MAKSHNARRAKRIPAGNARSAKEVAALTLRSFVYAMGFARCSQTDAARWMGLSLSTVQRWLAGKIPVNPMHVLRSRRLAGPFCEDLCRAVAFRNGRAA